jgi:hypothetical protein
MILTSTVLTGQMSGNYTIDPSGSGARNFKKLNDASAALDVQGVSGPVKITVASGTYAGTWFLPRVAGASKTNRILLEAATPWATTITGDPTNSRSVDFVFGTPAVPVEWIILDGFRFQGLVNVYEDQRYNARSHRNLEIRNCEFSGGSLTLHGSDHSVHHNFFRSVGKTPGLRLRADRSVVHHNVVQDGDFIVSGTYFSFRGGVRVYNNLIYGGTGSALTAYFAYDLVIAHNTLVSKASGYYGVVTVSAHGLRPVSIHGNIIYNSDSSTNAGSVIKDLSPLAPGIRSDGNLFFKASTSGPFVDLGAGGVYKSLSAWQLGSSQDKNSIEADPKFKNSSSNDYHLPWNSPARDKAFGTPLFVKTDLDDFARDAKPDMGCYEAFESFTLFGKGCPGTLFHVPQLGISGSPTLGSKNFAFTLGKALGGTQAFLAIGGSNTNWGPIPLPIPFGGTCKVLVSLDLLNPVSVAGTGAGNGTASVPISIPNNSSLRGKHFYVQWAVVDPTAARRLAFTEGGDLTFR